jgi:gamma-glutamyltranspeptidase / glutathione hydrolase
MKTNGIAILILLLASALRAQDAGTLVAARDGMVVSASPEATQVGLHILERGGNAVDAAVAVGFALAVTYPQAGNLGGGGYIVLRMADGRCAAIDGRETAPGRATRGMYLDGRGDPVPALSLEGPIAAGVPGSVDALLTALERFGSLPRRTVLSEPILLARRGFPLHARLAASFAAHRDEFARYPSSSRIFTRGGRAYRAGDRWRQPDLARTLERIAELGRDGFYRGVTAACIARAMQRDGGIMTQEDLAAYRCVERQPLRGMYRGREILTMPPSSGGGTTLLQMLGMLEGFPLGRMGMHSVASMHVMIECMRRAYADRSQHLGDPAFTRVPLDWLLSPAYARERRGSIDTAHATPSSLLHAGQPPVEGGQTTHYSVMDQWGNAVSVTTTINSLYGGAYVVDGTGFLLNNEMDDFSRKPGVPDQFGLVGGEANSIAPGKRMLSSMTPTIVVGDSLPCLVLGSPGGSTITTTVLQVIVNVVDFGCRLDSAIAAKRFHHQWMPDTVRYEAGLEASSDIEALRARGHHTEQCGGLGRVDAIYYDRGRHLFYGCSDPRGYGSAGGYTIAPRTP